jgi:hypothetical protein
VVHVDQELNADVVQWIGHGPWVHACVSAVWPQALPPFVGSAVATRLRVCEPALHDVLHAPKSPKLGMSQSVGHACALHSWVSSSCGHALPPSVGCVMVARVRDCEPLPHDLVQEVQLSVKAT